MEASAGNSDESHAHDDHRSQFGPVTIGMAHSNGLEDKQFMHGRMQEMRRNMAVIFTTQTESPTLALVLSVCLLAPSRDHDELKFAKGIPSSPRQSSRGYLLFGRSHCHQKESLIFRRCYLNRSQQLRIFRKNRLSDGRTECDPKK
jgi:hypothetical protein